MSTQNARELMLEFTAFSFRDPNKAAEMFAEDGAFEIPYLATFGVPSPYKGRHAMAGFFQLVRDLFPVLEVENTKVLIDTPERAFGEHEFAGVSGKTGRSVHQLFFGRPVAENGKIKLLREALNSFEVARAAVPDSAGLFCWPVGISTSAPYCTIVVPPVNDSYHLA
jgi:hypothetical protein